MVPIYGIYAFIVGWALSIFIVSFICINKLKKRTKFKLDLLDYFVKPCICITGGCILSKMLFIRFLLAFNKIISLSTAICVMAIIYLMLLIFTDCISISFLKRFLKIK